jgi:predicted HTH transcriptional regulator
MSAAGLQEPIFNSNGFFKVIFKREIQTVDGKETEKGGKEAEKGGKEIISELQAQILDIISKNKNITASQLAEMLNINSRTVEKNTKFLREMRLLERKGGRKQGYWEVKK